MSVVDLLGMVGALVVLITVHEYGHYRMAVACGVKVVRFSFGFGRVLLRWRSRRHPDGTEFVVSAVPLGGYVLMLGDNDPAAAAADRARTLNGRPLWQRALVVAAGPAANLLLAVALFAGVRAIGTREPAAILAAPPAGTLFAQAGVQAGDRVVAVAPVDADAASVDDGLGATPDWTPVRSIVELDAQVTRAIVRHAPLRLELRREDAATARTVTVRLDKLPSSDLDAATAQRLGMLLSHGAPVLEAPDAGSPAAAAGLRAGDRVLSVGGVPVDDSAALISHIRASVANGRGLPLSLEVRRDGRDVAVVVTPQVERGGDGKPYGRIGVPLADVRFVEVRDGPVAALQEGVRLTWQTAATSLEMMGRMITGHASLRNLSGTITVMREAGRSASHGLVYFMGFLASVSVGLGVLNLLPLPILDGGTLMYYLFEGVTGRPVPERWLAQLQRGGLVILLLLMSLALSNDVVRLLGQQ